MVLGAGGRIVVPKRTRRGIGSVTESAARRAATVR
jgi:bifunctional DNA-binding transcriptional regulator/antitoxin component of YhaV-PrlF toxin-antitoxin module